METEAEVPLSFSVCAVFFFFLPNMTHGWECRHHRRVQLELQGIAFAAEAWSQPSTLLDWDSALKLFSASSALQQRAHTVRPGRLRRRVGC